MLMIEKGKINRAVKGVLFGSEGSGKTTFASNFPDPLFIDAENGSFHLDVKRTQRPESWSELKEIISDVKADTSVCKTLVIDTLDWVETLAIKDVCKKYNVQSIDNIGFGKGYTYVQDYFTELLSDLDSLIDKGVNVLLIAHAKQRRTDLPEEMGTGFDRYELKLSKGVSPLVKEWSDLLGFINFKTLVITNESNVRKGVSNKRMLYLNHNAAWDAKNRFGLPDEVELDFKNIAHIFKSGVISIEDKMPQVGQNTANNENSDLVKKIKQLLTENGLTETELEAVVVNRGKYPEGSKLTDYSAEFINRWVLPNFNKIKEQIIKIKENQ